MLPLSPRITSASRAWPAVAEVVARRRCGRSACRRRRRSCRRRRAACAGERQAEQVELPPMRSSWPRLPKITSLPPLPSM